MKLDYSGTNIDLVKYLHIFIAVLPVIIIADLFAKSIPVWILAMLIFSYQLVFCNRFENAFFFIPFAGLIAGSIFTSRGLPGLGGFFIPLGLLLISKDIYIYRKELIRGFTPLFLLFLLFSISAYLGKGGDYFTTKLTDTILTGIFFYISISILFLNRNEVRFSLLALIFILWAVFMLRLEIDINNLPGPSNIFHFGYMRDQRDFYGQFALITKDDFTISYHTPGFYALIGLSLIMTHDQESNKLMKWYLWILTFIIIFYTGARQNFLGFIVMLMFYILSLKRYSFIFKLAAVSASAAVALVVLSSINSEVIQSLLSSSSTSEALEASGRGALLYRGLELFKANPIFGVGFGHYSYFGNFGFYPHNIIIELLSEIGIIGFSIVLILCYSVIAKSRQKLISLHKQDFKIYLIWIPLIIRAMTSKDLTYNIIVLSFIFALLCIYNQSDQGISSNNLAYA